MYRSIKSHAGSNIMCKFLHIIDCFFVILLFRFLTIFYDVLWTSRYSNFSFAIFGIVFIIFYAFGLYRPWRGITFYREFLVIIKSWGAVIGVILMIFFVTKTSYSFSRRVSLTWFVVTPVLIFIVHMIFGSIVRYIYKRGFNLKKAVIIGTGDLSVRFADYLDQIPWSGIKLLGFFDEIKNDQKFFINKCPILGTIDQVDGYLKDNPVDYIYIALPLSAEEKILSLICKIRTLGAQVMLIPDLFSFSVFNAEVQYLGNMVTINFNPDLQWKRYFDIIFSIFVLILTFPVFIIIGLLIKIGDFGPVFYGHPRITATGREFKCWKFRTMHVNADQKLQRILEIDDQARQEWEKNFKLKNDPRITWIGKILRKTSLDELPQFFNVLKGDMSVVGARPIVLKELNDYYKDKAGIYCSIKPGITGLWQIGKRNDIEDYAERIKLDTDYILQNSLWLDLKIISKTVLCMFKCKGAY